MKEISGRAFAERFALNPLGFAWLLGAGASATAGIPTGYQMIQEFRTRLFASETGISLREIDPADPVWQSRIDLHHERMGILPPKGDPSEYSRAFEALYPTPDDRRLFIRNQVSKGSPSLGHKVLGSLLGAQKTPCVFTTNFDSLIESAATIASQLLPASERGTPTLAAIDNAARAETCLRESEWPLIVKLHGDYQSVELKNTDQELAQQDAQLRLVLTQALQRFGLVIVGYSGRDDSVMQALNAVLRSPVRYPKGIYWLCRDADSLLPAVRELLEQAELAQVDVERTIHALRTLPIGSTLIMDYRLDEQCLPPIERTMMQFTAHVMAAGGEPWQSSGTPEQMKALLAIAGFDVEEDLGPAELNHRYLARRRDGLQIAGGGFRYLSAIKAR
ncbi:SIR2 family protein [Achromobacter ruhlandii]|uniref:SIR2 family protein n=1 Tax=Achromobacter ruhlandii TaxID=72557 RepID=UPI003B9D314D